MEESKRLFATEWFLNQPEVLKKAIERRPPVTFYKIRKTGEKCQIDSYDEPESGFIKDVTVTVQIEGKEKRTGVPLSYLLVWKG